MSLLDDDIVTVHRPGRESVEMRWAQWQENRARYESAGFTAEARWETHPFQRDIADAAGFEDRVEQALPPLDAWPDSDLVAELLDVDHGLTDWEVGFADDVARRLDAGRTLSSGQRAKAIEVLRRLRGEA